MDLNFSMLSWNCIVPDTQLIIKHQNKKFITDFMYFQDLFTNKLQEVINIQEQHIQTLSKNGQFVNINAVMRRYVNEDLYEIKFSNGRQLIATSDHIMEIYHSSPVLKYVKDLQVGDKVEVTLHNIDQLQKVNSLNLIDLIGSSDEIIISNSTFFIKQLYSTKKTKFYQKLQKIRVNKDLYTPYLTLTEYMQLRSFLNLDESKIELKYIQSHETIDAIIPVNINLGKFIGYILSEGYIGDASIEFANTNINLINDFIKCAYALFPRLNMTLNAPAKKDTSPCIRVKIYNKLLVQLFNGILAYKQYSNDIKLANWTKFANYQFISGLFAAEIDGDGTVDKNCIRIVSASKNFIYGLSEILSLYNIPCIYGERNIKGTVASINDHKFIRNFNSYDLCIVAGYNLLKQLLKNNCFKMNKFDYKYNNQKKKYFTKIISIKSIPYNGYVYDFETADHYFSANGIISHNCLHIDLEKIFENGFVTGHGFIRTPNSIRSYAALAAIAIQSSQNDMFGGQSLPAFDWTLAPGVSKTFIKEFKNNLKIAVKTILKNSDIFDEFIETINYDNKDKLPSFNNKEKLNEVINNFIKNNDDDSIAPKAIIRSFEFAFEQANENTEEETWQAMEAFVHNMNTLASRAGSQVPFSSINLGTDTSNEGRLVTKKLLDAIYAGLGHGETSIFPKYIGA